MVFKGRTRTHTFREIEGLCGIEKACYLALPYLDLLFFFDMIVECGSCL